MFNIQYQLKFRMGILIRGFSVIHFKVKQVKSFALMQCIKTQIHKSLFNLQCSMNCNKPQERPGPYQACKIPFHRECYLITSCLPGCSCILNHHHQPLSQNRILRNETARKHKILYSVNHQIENSPEVRRSKFSLFSQ